MIFPAPAAEFTFRPPKELVTPNVPVNVTAPPPDVIVKISLEPPFVSIAPPNVTAPTPVPVLIVVVPLFARSTPDVANAIASFVVVKVAAAVMSIF